VRAGLPSSLQLKGKNLRNIFNQDNIVIVGLPDASLPTIAERGKIAAKLARWFCHAPAEECSATNEMK
jgi:hypothetical protein